MNDPTKINNSNNGHIGSHGFNNGHKAGNENRANEHTGSGGNEADGFSINLRGRDRGRHHNGHDPHFFGQRDDNIHFHQHFGHDNNPRFAEFISLGDFWRNIFLFQNDPENNPYKVILPGTHHANTEVRTSSQSDFLLSVRNYLSGTSDGAEFTHEMRQVLNQVSSILGNDFVNRLSHTTNPEQSINILEYALRHVNSQFNNQGFHTNQSRQPVENPNTTIQFAIEDVVSAYQLTRHFDQMKQSGGHLVREAESKLANFLFSFKESPEKALLNINKNFTHEQTIEYLSINKILSDISPAEVLRDLRSGAFLSSYETYNPVPLTNHRARVASEMIQLMHTLDSMDRYAEYLAQQKIALGQPVPLNDDAIGVLDKFLLSLNLPSEFLSLLKAALGNEKAFTSEELMTLWQIALPGRAGRNLIPEIALTLNEMLSNADGRKTLVTKDGTQMLLDKIVWLSSAGGTITNSSNADSFPTRLSPLLLHGFDAIYSLIGFDGRSPENQHFALVQANINNSGFEWVYGQEPLSLGWMREMIERLKDSKLTDHNLLGEQLEEALAHGCFHTMLVDVSVEKGSPVTDNIRVTPFTPTEFAFAHAGIN